jgi:hypothetical protein
MPDIFDTVADKVSAPDIFDRVGSAPPEQPAYFPAPEPGAPQLPVPTAEDLKKYGGGEALEDPTLPNITSSVGKSITAAGRVLAAEGEDVAEQVANRVKGYKSLEPAWRNTMALDPFNIGEEGMPPTPYERDLEEQKGVTKLAGDLSTGIVKTLPQMYLGGEIAGPFKALGFSERAAQMAGMGTAFGFDEKGFDAKQAALMAAFPLAADYGGKIVETTLGKIGVKPESELARQAVKWVGSLAGSQAYMDATQLPEYTDPRLTPEQKRELFVNNLAQNIAFHLVQIPGMKGQADAVNKATREAAEDYADGFWKAQTEKQPDASEEFQKALSKVYPAQAAPPISEINNRIRQTLKPVPQVNRLRVPLPAQPQPETPNATRTLVQQESGQPQHQGTPQGENLQPNAPQEGQEIGGQTGGGNRPVGAAPKPNAEVGPPPADDAGRLQWLKALPSPTPEQITERDALQAKSYAVKAKMAAEFAKLKAAQKPPLAPNQTEISPDQAKAISGGRPNLMPKSGETKPQLQDTTGEYFIGQTADGRFFTEHRPKPPVKQPAKPAETPSVETPIDKNPTETESAANAGKSNIPPAPTSGIPVREPPGTRPPVAPAGPVAPSVGGEGAGGVAGGGGNVEGGDVPGSGPRGSEQPDIGSTGRTGDNARPGTRPPAVEGAEAPQAQLGGEQPRNVRETTALGLDQIRAALSDPRLGYDARTVQTALKFLDEPVMRKLDWSKLLLAIRQKLEGNARGAAWLSDNLIEMSGAANPTTFPHEIFHFLYEMLPADYKAAIDGLRIDELRKQFGDNIPPELEAGRMTSDAFQASGLSGDLYPLSNAGEFLANFAGERYAREAFEGRHEPAGFWDKFKADLKSWVTAIVNTVKRTLKVRPDMNRVYDELLSGRWVPTPDSGRAYDDRHAQLALTREQYEKQRAFGEQGTPERTMAAFGDVAEMKRKAAEDISAGDRALKLTRTTNQELLTQLASSDMASPRLAFGNYDAMRARTEGSDQGLRSGVIIDALRGMTYEQHRMAALRVKLAEQEALVSGKRFQDMLKNYWGRRAEAETAEEVRKTFENQIGVETGLVVRELNQRGKTDAQYEQLRSDLARLEKLPEFTEAVSRRVDDIVRTVLASEGGERLLSGLGSKNGTEVFNAYLDLKQQRPTRPQGAGLLGMVDPELLSPRDLAKVEAANRAREMAEQEAHLTGDQRVFAQLASAVLAANSELRMKLLSLEYARMHPEFQAKITEVGERFKKAFEQDPGNAVKQVVKLAGSLKARGMDAEAAWLRLNKAVSREVEKLHTLQEAVEIDNRTVASPEWKQLVNRILADNSKLSPAFRVPDSELPHVTGENVWNEFSGKQQFRSPNGGVYDIDLGYTAKSVGEAQSQMQMYLGDLAEWLNDPKNADSPDRAYWSNRYDFVENALNVSTVTKPAAIYGLLGARTPWGMQQYLFESTTLPAARIAGIALNNWKQAWAIQDQWFQDTAELRTRLAQAARSHGLNPDMDMQLYREQILDRLASEYRHGNALKAGDNLNNGVKLTFQDIAAFKLQGQKIAELFNANRNIAREKVMQDGLLMDDFLKNVFAVRAPQELGALPGTTLPHEFSERGKALARQVAAISPGDAFHLKMLFDEPHVFDQFVQRFIAERRADYSTLTPFEDLYKQIAAKWRAGDADAPRNIDEIVDYIEANTPEAVSREVIEKTVLGEMESQLRKFHREFVAKEAPSDTRANRASKSTEFTKGFQREVGSSFFYDYGAVNAREIRSIGLDSMNFHLVRYVRALDSALEAYREAMAKYDNLTGQKAKTALIKATRADFKSGKDFRDFEQLQDEMRSIARLKDQIPKAYGSEQIMSADLFGKMGRFTGDAVSAALSGPLTVGKVYVGSVTKMGLVLGQMERWYAAAYLKGLISTVMSTVEMGGRYYDEFHPAKAPGRVMRVLRDAKLDGLKIALARELQAATEGFFQAGKFFNQQYQFGMGFKSPAGFRAINILEQPFSHGGYYDPKFSQKAWLRLPQKAFYRALSVAEAPLEILKSIYPQIGYAISYDAAARAAGWTVDAIGSQARRSFEFLERTGGLSQYNLDNPRDPKNILPANYVLPRGIWPKGETNLYQARNLWERSIDMPLNEMVLNYWKRLAATPKAERGNVSFLASDVADPVKAKHVEEVRAAALMKAVVEDVHHATVANRPIQFRLDSTWRFIFPMLGWPTQTLRGTLQSLGKAPTDSRGRMLLAAASATTVLAAFAMAALTGETEKGLKKETSEQVNGEIYPEPMVWQAKGAAEAAKLLAIDSVAVIPYAHNLASELLGESSQTVNETGMSVFTLQKFGSIMRYLKGVIATHDATYGLPQLAKSLLPFGRSLINRLDSQTGLVELKNARTVVQKNGPKDLLGEQKPMEYPTPTELSPFKQQLSNAVFQGDQQAVTQAAGAFIAKAVDLGKTPEEAKALLRQAMASFDPVAIAGRKMTDAQYQQTLDNSSTGEAAVLARAANNWNNANAALGLSVPLTKGERGLSGGGGGGAIAVAAAPKNRLRRVSNRLRAPHRASAKIGRARIHIKKLRAPVSRFRKPRNRLRQRKVQTYF